MNNLIKMLYLVLSVIFAQTSIAGSLPSEEQIEGVLKLCSLGKVKSIEGDVKGKITFWKKGVEGMGVGSISDLGGLLATVPSGNIDSEVQKNYNNCIIDTIKTFIGGNDVVITPISQTANQTQQVQIVLQQVISDLPPEKRTFAEGVVESIGGVLNAKEGSDSEIEAAAREFRARIMEAKILSYDITSSPFPLTLKRTVMLCDNAFSLAYALDNSNGSQRFLINGRIDSGFPGVVFKAKEGNKKLLLRYMEYLKEEQTAIMSFQCN